MLLILAAAGAGLALRLPDLNLRPMHGDEAVHTVKLDELWRTGRYVYDAHEFHGPTLYYFTFPSIWLSGARDFAATDAAMFRIVPVAFGVGLILLMLLVRDGLGRGASVVAAVLAACSPALVFYSRYYIQETLLAFFTFAAIGAGWRYWLTRRWYWAVIAGACVGLMHATKETAVIAFGCMGAAWLVTWLIGRARRPAATRVPPPEASGDGATQTDQAAAVQDHPLALTARAPAGRMLMIGAVIAVVVSVLFYSGFGTNWRGPLDSIRTYATWFERGSTTRLHDHPWYYYLRLLGYTHYRGSPVWTEGVILALAVVGIFAALAPRRAADPGTPLLRYLCLYALLMTAAYSVIPYKTPWCAVQFLQPLTLLAGAGAAALWRWAKRPPARCVIAAGLIAGTVNLVTQARAASFRFYADQRNPYVYAHPVTDVENLAAFVEKLAAVHPLGRQMTIKVIADNPWPLPWYLREFERVGYWEQAPDNPDAPVVIVSAELEPAVGTRLHARYHDQVMHYGLRPGEVLSVYVQQDLWQAFAAKAASQRSGPP